MTSNDSCAGIYVRCDPPDRRTHRVLTAGAYARALKPSFSNLARFLDNRPFPLIGAAVGLIAVVNVVSAAAMLLSV